MVSGFAFVRPRDLYGASLYNSLAMTLCNKQIRDGDAIRQKISEIEIFLMLIIFK